LHILVILVGQVLRRGLPTDFSCVYVFVVPSTRIYVLLSGVSLAIEKMGLPPAGNT